MAPISSPAAPRGENNPDQHLLNRPPDEQAQTSQQETDQEIAPSPTYCRTRTEGNQTGKPNPESELEGTQPQHYWKPSWVLDRTLVRHHSQNHRRHRHIIRLNCQPDHYPGSKTPLQQAAQDAPRRQPPPTPT